MVGVVAGNHRPRQFEIGDLMAFAVVVLDKLAHLMQARHNDINIPRLSQPSFCSRSPGRDIERIKIKLGPVRRLVIRKIKQPAVMHQAKVISVAVVLPCPIQRRQLAIALVKRRNGVAGVIARHFAQRGGCHRPPDMDGMDRRACDNRGRFMIGDVQRRCHRTHPQRKTGRATPYRSLICDGLSCAKIWSTLCSLAISVAIAVLA